MTIELALTPDGKWDIDTAGLAAAAHDAGFSAVGLGEARADDSAASTLAAAGLRCHELLAMMVSADADATLAKAESLVAAAERVHADWLLTVFRDLVPDTARVVRRCADMLAEVGTGVAVEFSPLGPLTSLGAALELIDGTDNAGVMIDSWHFCRGDSTWEQLEQVPLDRVAYLQFDDALEPTSDNPIAETMHRRAFPGDGVLELDRFTSTLRTRGFDGLVSVEVLSADLRQLPVPDFAKQAYQKTAAFWL